MHPLRILTLIILFTIPVFTFAAGLVPCGGTGEPACQACHVLSLGQNLLTWFITIMASIIALTFAFGGMKMVMSGGNGEAVSQAKGMMTNSVIGLIILLSSYLIVDTFLKLFVKDALLGTWNKIDCVALPAYSTWAEGTSRPVVGGGATSVLTESQLASRRTSTATYKNDLCTAATAQGIGGQCDSLQALMSIESSGNAAALSPVGAVGLMQIMPSTARTLDSTLIGLSDAEVRAKLLNPTYNMQLGTKLYSNLYSQYNGDLTKVYAAYNGGPGANLPSTNCPGQMRWQCLWDNNEHTIPNTGYAETRNYVSNVNAVRCTTPGESGS